MKQAFLALTISLLALLPARADTDVTPNSNGPLGMTAVKGTIPATSTAVTLTQPSKSVTIVNGSGSATLYFSFVSPATTSTGPIFPNSSYTYWGVPVSTVYLIGSASGDPYGVIAH